MNEIDKGQNKNKVNPQTQEIDLLEYVIQLWKSKNVLLKACGIGAILGLIIALSIPKTYTSHAVLTPELDKMINRQMSTVVSMMGMRGLNQQMPGISLGKAEMIVKSTPFMLELVNTKVRRINSKEEISIVDYIREQRSPWWNKILALPFKAVGGIKSLFTPHKTATTQQEMEKVPFQLTKKELSEIAALKNCISVTANNKSGDISITTSFQDPMVCKLMADSIMYRLQDYIIKYQTNKAKTDYQFLETLYKEKQKAYFDAQDAYATFMDSNHKLVRQSASTERTRLQNDINLAFQIYSQVASQLQLAKAKIQEDRPVFAVIEPAIVPLQPAGYGKIKIILIWIFLSFLITAGWIIFGKDFFSSFKKRIKEANKKDMPSLPDSNIMP